MSAELIHDDAAWRYPGFGASISTRRLRLWRVEPGRLVAVITEHLDDAGTSITNAAAAVAGRLAAEYPDDIVDVVEHYTATELDAEHYDAVTLDERGRPSWRRLNPADLATRLGTSFTAGTSGPSGRASHDRGRQ